MFKKYIKVVLVIILSLMMIFEVGYIIKTNVLNIDSASKEEATSTPKPSELPVVGVTPQPEPTQIPEPVME